LQPSAGILAFFVAALVSAPAYAAVFISSATTQNMSCRSGVCAPTAARAVLNAGDLQSLLAAGNVVVTTTGSGIQARDIGVKAPLQWSTSSTLTFDAYHSIAIGSAISVSGGGGMSLTNNDGGFHGTISFGSTGSISFAELQSVLTIHGEAYTLVSDIAKLASDIAQNPSGSYAMAANYDSGGKVFNSAPIPTTFQGKFDGLGNTISNFQLISRSEVYDPLMGLFAEIGTSGAIKNLRLASVTVNWVGEAGNSAAGILVGLNGGLLSGDHAVGTMLGRTYNNFGGFGGLTGENTGVIEDSDSSASLKTTSNATGGLVGINDGVVEDSYATGALRQTANGGEHTPLGGLAGQNNGTISNAFATGAVTGRQIYAVVGGLVGTNSGTINDSYSTGALADGADGYIGGLIGYDNSTAGDVADCYWDLISSGINNATQGAGYPPNDPGIAGLTTSQFQSGLPSGFDAKSWTERHGVNGGFPYLLADPPPN